MKASFQSMSEEEIKKVEKMICDTLRDCDFNSLTKLVKEHTSDIFSWELPSQHDSSKGSVLTLAIQHAYFNWEKYEPLLKFLVESLSIQKYDNGDKAMQFIFDRSISFDGKFSVESHGECFEFLLKLGARVEFKETVPKMDFDDIKSCCILILLALSNTNSQLPNALWYYQNILKLFHLYPSEMQKWYERFEQQSSITTNRFITHPEILRRVSSKKPESIIIGTCNLAGFKVTHKQKLSDLANIIIQGHYDIFAVQELGDNRIILDLVRRLGPDWNFLLSPQVKPHDGRGYVESYGFLYRIYYKLNDYGHLSGDNTLESRPMFFASFSIGKNQVVHIINVHSSQTHTMFSITNLTNHMRKISKENIKSLVVVGDFYIQSTSPEWNAIRDYKFVSCFETVTGIKNLRGTVTSTTPEAIKVYDNIWLDKDLFSNSKECGIMADAPWDSGHFPLFININLDNWPVYEDAKLLSLELSDWSFEDEKFWEDSDFFGPFFGTEGGHTPISWEPHS